MIILFLRNITRITIRLVLFRRNKIIIAHACSAGRHKPWVYDNKIFAPQRGAITSGKCYPVLNHSRNSIRTRRIHLHFMRSYKQWISLFNPIWEFFLTLTNTLSLKLSKMLIGFDTLPMCQSIEEIAGSRINSLSIKMLWYSACKHNKLIFSNLDRIAENAKKKFCLRRLPILLQLIEVSIKLARINSSSHKFSAFVTITTGQKHITRQSKLLPQLPISKTQKSNCLANGQGSKTQNASQLPDAGEAALVKVNGS